MRRHGNTLYVTTQGAYLFADGAAVAVKVDGEVRLRVPLHLLDGVVTFGRVSCSPFVVGRCAERGIGVSFLTERGRFLARVQGPVHGNVLLRRAQYRRSDDPGSCVELVRAFLLGKILNARRLVQRSLRDHPDGAEVSACRRVVVALANSARRVEKASSVEELRGVEGEAARRYYGVFDAMLRADDSSMRFERRSRRPPLNALLSFVYTLLVHDVASALEAVGLDPQVGFLHVDRPGRPGLALDMMEEFRSVFADRLVLALVNRRQLNGKDFEPRESGAVFLKDAARREVLKAYQDRKTKEIRHPFIDERVTVGLLFHVQAQLLARFLRGDLDGYPPFFEK